MVDEPVLDQFVLFEGLAPFFGVSINTLDGFEHIQKALPGVSHNGTASPRMRSRIRGLMPRSLTTSTSTPRTSRSSTQSAA